LLALKREQNLGCHTNSIYSQGPFDRPATLSKSVQTASKFNAQDSIPVTWDRISII